MSFSLARLIPLVAAVALVGCDRTEPETAVTEASTAQASTAEASADPGMMEQEQQALAERRAREAADPVTGVIERAEICLHFAGEEAFDDARRAQIGRAFDDNRCDTVVADGEALKVRQPQDAERIDAAIADLRP